MMIMLIVMGLTLSYAISYAGVASNLARFIVSSGISPWAVMIMLFVLWLILGCLMDPGSMVVLTIPFVYPALVEMGFDPIWIGVVSTLMVEVGMITPPVGLNLFILKTVTGLKMSTIIVGSLPYVVCLVIGLVLLCFFPQIALFLPSRM
jgi:TRAP-type C4-dicarboxylate transport system permease large subunit